MRSRYGRDQDGVWRIGPVRLLVVVGVGYLAVVLAFAALTGGGDFGPSAGAGFGTLVPEAATPTGPGDDTEGPSAAVTPESKDIRVGSVEDPHPTPSAPPRTAAPPPPTAAPPSPTTAPPPPPVVVTSYEAESPVNGLAGTRTFTCHGCSGQKKVGYVGRGMGTLEFNGVTARAGGTASVTIAYVNGEGPRLGHISVNRGRPIVLSFPGTGGWETVGTMTVTTTLRPGVNSLWIFNPYGPAPDFDRITVSVR